MTEVSEVYTRAEHAQFAAKVESDRQGLREDIKNRVSPLAERLTKVEAAQRDAITASITAETLTQAQTRIYSELQEIHGMVHELNAVGIKSELSGIRTTLSEHGEMLQMHTAQLNKHEAAIDRLNDKALTELKTEFRTGLGGVGKSMSELGMRVTELEKADGKKAIKVMGLVAAAAIGALVTWMFNAMGLIGG